MTTSLDELLDGKVEVVGALDLDRTATGVVPRRLPAWTRPQIPDLFMDFVVQSTSGVRLRFRTDSTSVELDAMVTMLHFEPAPFTGTAFDLTVDGELVASVPSRTGTVVRIDRLDPTATRLEAGDATTVRFDGLDPGDKTVEVWLPHDSTVELRGLRVDAGASIEPAPDDRPTWLHYGSSISHCIEADSPTGTWPAVAASIADVRLLSLGFGGQCMLDGFVARTIRDEPVDLISLKVGINIVNADAYRERTFGTVLHAFLDTVREGHPDTPILLVSPIFCGPAEDRPGPTIVEADGRTNTVPGFDELRATSMTLTKIRSTIAGIVEQRRALGDEHLHHLDGLCLFGPDDADDLPDALHPNAAGYRRIGERFAGFAFADGAPLEPPRR